jgi:hypothetical protein
MKKTKGKTCLVATYPPPPFCSDALFFKVHREALWELNLHSQFFFCFFRPFFTSLSLLQFPFGVFLFISIILLFLLVGWLLLLFFFTYFPSITVFSFLVSNSSVKYFLFRSLFSFCSLTGFFFGD